jgi:hypothetical protein
MVVLVRAVEMEMAGLSAQSWFFAPDFIAGTSAPGKVPPENSPVEIN